MKDLKLFLAGIAVVLATITASGNVADAQGRRMLVLIDASGSMNLLRTDGRSRFQAAQERSTERIIEQAMFGLDGVAVYTFRGTEMFSHTAGFVDVNTAITAVGALSQVSGLTPLAGSMCDAVDILVAEGDASTVRLLQLSSDGEENSTPVGHPCHGPWSTEPSPYSAGSWQNLVRNKVLDSVIVDIDLFNPAPITGFAARTGADLEGAPATSRTLAAVTSNAQPPTLEAFFSTLAKDTGGDFRIIFDNAPLPVYADLNDDYCVDVADALMVLERFGQTVPPADGKFDLNRDGYIGLADYLVVLSHLSEGCGAGYPYEPMVEVSCDETDHVVIEGRSIETAGNAIAIRGSCQVTIRNSVIVAGGQAINAAGSARVKIENSYLAGETAGFELRGKAKLTAKGSLFRGKRTILGTAQVVDLGGNSWD
jgi:hypothetical protein